MFRVYGWTIEYADLSASDELLSELIIVPTDLAFYFTTSNERVHQNGTSAQIALRAVSGATHLLEAVSFFYFLFCFFVFAARTSADIVQCR